MSSLTDRQREILDYVLSHTRIAYPTVREIAAHFQVFPATIQEHLDALRRKGHLPAPKKRKTT